MRNCVRERLELLIRMLELLSQLPVAALAFLDGFFHAHALNDVGQVGREDLPPTHEAAWGVDRLRMGQGERTEHSLSTHGERHIGV